MTCEVTDKLSSGRFYGEDLSLRDACGLRLTEKMYSSTLSLPKHFHEYACFSVILRGGFTESYRGKTMEWRPLSVGFTPPGEVHSNRFRQGGTRVLNIQLDLHWLKRATENLEGASQPLVFNRGRLSWLGMRLYSEARKKDEASLLAIEGIGLEMLAELSRSSRRIPDGKIPDWLRQARELIHAHFTDSLSLSKLASLVGVHPIHLATAFRHHYHSSVGAYVRKLRVEFACRQINTAHLPLAQIALSAGFSSQAHFCTAFKQLTGMTPSEYRKFRRSP